MHAAEAADSYSAFFTQIVNICLQHAHAADASVDPVQRRLFNRPIHLGMEIQQVDFVKKKKKKKWRNVFVAGYWLEACVLTCASCEKSGKVV